MIITLATLLLAFAPPFEAVVTDVHDGDTIKVTKPGETDKIEIRLYGIDAPEIKVSTRKVDGKRVEIKYEKSSQPYGFTSRAMLSQLIYSKKVTVITESNAKTFGRVVARIKYDGVDINTKMVESGMAHWYVQYAKHDMQFETAQARAKAAKRGLWSDPNAIAPWEYRKKKEVAK